MTNTVIGIRFKKAGKIYYFDPMGVDIAQYDHAVVETVQGIEYGEVALGPRKIDIDRFPFPVKPIIRKATAKDDADYRMLREKEKAAKAVFEEKVRERGLEMNLINVEYTFDKKKAVFYFTAEGRVDFRDLVKDLASVFHVRIELRQVGVRDEAKLFHTLGCCGRNTCCSEWLGDFTPVSIKMAKDQNVSLNAAKISGVCGRLLCCLTYENEFYKDVTRRMPKTGQMVETPDGVGQVYRLDVLRENVIVKIQNDRDETEIKTYALSDIGHSTVTKPENAPVKKEKDKDKEKNGGNEGNKDRKKAVKAEKQERLKIKDSEKAEKTEKSEETQEKQGRQRRRNRQGKDNRAVAQRNAESKIKNANIGKNARRNEPQDHAEAKSSKDEGNRNSKRNGRRRYGRQQKRKDDRKS